MISPRILFEGDPTEAVKYVGVAKEFGRSTFAAGILSKVWRLGEDVQIRVQNSLQSRICKVWIKASAVGKAGYQFYTTSPTVQWAYWTDPDNDFCPGGSMIYAPTPKFPRDPLGYQTSFTRAELDAIKLYAYPTHTLVEDPPQKTVGTEIRDECPFTPMPEQVGGKGGLNQIMNTGSTFAARNAWQINGIPEHSCYFMTPKYVVIDEEPVFTGHYESKFSILTAWQQPGGYIFSYGMYSPMYYMVITDVGYDMSPQKITTNMIGQMPDGDWPERACITRAGTPEFGYRWYVILHTANDDWLCWPYLPADELDPSIAANAPENWKAQAYKSNVPAEYAQKARPEFPDWVYSTGKERREHLNPLTPEPEPRVTFHFNSSGDKAIGAMVERTPISEVGESEFRIIDFMHPDSGVGRSRSNWAFDFTSVWPSGQESSFYAPVEKLTGFSTKIDATKRLYGTSKPPGPQLYQYDRLGIVELLFTIKVTGPGLGDFDFSISLGRTESPDDLYTYGVGALIDIGYAQPMLSSPLVHYVSIPGLNRSAEVALPPLADELVTAFLMLYHHEDQKKYDLGAYCSSNTSPTKSKVSFYKNDDYRAASNAILELPLSQRHGSGYAGPPLINPETGEIIGLPAPAHEFVEYPYNASIEKHRAPNDVRSPRYVYDAKLVNLDISTLSFYYKARINKLTTDLDPYILENVSPYTSVIEDPLLYELHKEFNEQAELCNVYIFGRIAHESIVGVEGMSDHLRGWADKAPLDFPGDNEEKIPTTYKNTDIDLYYSETGSVSAPQWWWLNGACGFCIYKTIENSAYNRTWEHIYSGPFPYKNVGAKFYDDSNILLEPKLPGEMITEEEAKDFLRYAVEKWGEFIAGNLTSLFNVGSDTVGEFIQTEAGFTCEGVDKNNYGPNPNWYLVPFYVGYFFRIWYTSQSSYTVTIYYCQDAVNKTRSEGPFIFSTGPQAETLDYCYGNKNPFILAKSDFDIEKFINQSAWLMMKLCNTITEILNGGKVEGVQDAFNLASYALSRDNRYTIYDPAVFDMYGKVNTDNDLVIIKKYDWAVHLYNHYRLRRFTECSNTQEYGAIVTTPEGHYSYYHKDHYAINKKYTALGVYFLSKVRSEDDLFFADPSNVNALETRTGNTEAIDGINFDWKLVDGVCWYFGRIKTDHLDLYNMAFFESWRESMRNQGRNPPYALVSELPITGKYAEINFRPSFNVFLSSSPIRGEILYRPHKATDDYYYTLQLEIEFPNNTFLQSPWGFPGYYYFESRQYKKHIRLSPLFF